VWDSRQPSQPLRFAFPVSTSGSLAVWDSRQPAQPLRFVLPVSTSGSLAVWDSRQPGQPLRFVSTSVVDSHKFQRGSGSSILGQCGFGSGFNMGLQAARPTSQVCVNQCCGSALVSTRIRIQHFRSRRIRIRIQYGTLGSPANLSGLFQLVLWIRIGFVTRIRIQHFKSMWIRIRIQYGTPDSPPNLSGLFQLVLWIRISFNADPDPAFRSRRIRIRILGLINVAYPDPGSSAFLCFLCSDVGKVLVPVWNPDIFPTTKICT
jgi:hypothetical protein